MSHDATRSRTGGSWGGWPAAVDVLVVIVVGVQMLGLETGAIERFEPGRPVAVDAVTALVVLPLLLGIVWIAARVHVAWRRADGLTRGGRVYAFAVVVLTVVRCIRACRFDGALGDTTRMLATVLLGLLVTLVAVLAAPAGTDSAHAGWRWDGRRLVPRSWWALATPVLMGAPVLLLGGPVAQVDGDAKLRHGDAVVAHLYGDAPLTRRSWPGLHDRDGFRLEGTIVQGRLACAGDAEQRIASCPDAIVTTGLAVLRADDDETDVGVLEAGQRVVVRGPVIAGRVPVAVTGTAVTATVRNTWWHPGAADPGSRRFRVELLVLACVLAFAVWTLVLLRRVYRDARAGGVRSVAGAWLVAALAVAVVACVGPLVRAGGWPAPFAALPLATALAALFLLLVSALLVARRLCAGRAR